MAKGPRLDRVTDAILTEVASSLFAIGDIVAVEAQISITAGSVSGKGHTPSRPGQPPNNDTGVLADGIEVQQIAPFIVRVVSTAPYSRPLEFGTSKMAARPFLAPARDATRAEVRKLTAKAVNRAIRKYSKR